MDWNSPINIITTGMHTQLEGQVMKAVQNVGVVVDKDELIKCMNYDRDQYNQGYRNGRAMAFHNCILDNGEYCWQQCTAIEHCKECKCLGNGDINWFE